MRFDDVVHDEQAEAAAARGTVLSLATLKRLKQGGQDFGRNGLAVIVHLQSDGFGAPNGAQGDGSVVRTVRDGIERQIADDLRQSIWIPGPLPVASGRMLDHPVGVRDGELIDSLAA